MGRKHRVAFVSTVYSRIQSPSTQYQEHKRPGTGKDRRFERKASLALSLSTVAHWAVVGPAGALLAPMLAPVGVVPHTVTRSLGPLEPTAHSLCLRSPSVPRLLVPPASTSNSPPPPTPSCPSIPGLNAYSKNASTRWGLALGPMRTTGPGPRKGRLSNGNGGERGVEGGRSCGRRSRDFDRPWRPDREVVELRKRGLAG
ncbi:hypothetical protein CALCODRAFT_323731 [Calocera cornea HHB12733]|uniref:Uncharacterized protein n=1 Tax=Calocera cornea HHB12733 TaxID=1353952 RepID=A0A165F5T0_9BASI|nr:hypothetical protein CALCODRAFT_323731 [Calocera cornea HHB12733]